MTGPGKPHEVIYREMVDAVLQQRLHLHGEADLIQQWTPWAPAFRFDPRRDLEPNMAVLASFIRPQDELLEVGGGAGRVGLPLALRCRRLTNVEPSQAMGEQFLASAAESGITNAHLVQRTWADAPELQADVVITADVTYFIRDIVPFVTKLQQSARRLVCIWIWAVPPPNRHASLFELAHALPQALVPGHRELLPVLWDMGILPDVLVLPEPFAWPETLPGSRADAVRFALAQARATAITGAAERVEAQFESLFSEARGTCTPLWRPAAHGLLITWKPPG
jgi:hypothetical protein